MNQKPLGMKAYGSIGHLPGSRLGPGDHCVSPGQAAICTVKVRDKHDVVYVQEKLDGSNTAVAMVNGEILALGRAGYLAQTSPREQHQLFAAWVRANEERFRVVLREGERLCGEWLAQAHGTRYDLAAAGCDPWIPFDLMRGHERLTVAEMMDRVQVEFPVMPSLRVPLGPCEPQKALAEFQDANRFRALDPLEGVVYRVEHKRKVDYLAKYVASLKLDGVYLPEISGKATVWNWRPQ
jgi:hypothetical protein